MKADLRVWREKTVEKRVLAGVVVWGSQLELTDFAWP
jgi:hypothetical protein